VSYVRIAGTGTDEAFVVGVDGSFRKTTVGEQLRQNLNAIFGNGAKGGYLGGSRSQYLESASEIAVPDYWDVLIDWRKISGLTVRARVEVRTLNAGTSVTPRIKNVTDSTNNDGTASTSTSFTEQLIAISTPASLGVKRYRLYIIGGNATNGIGGLGQIEIYDNF
jgi:hypothetical protein